MLYIFDTKIEEVVQLKDSSVQLKKGCKNQGGVYGSSRDKL